MPSSNFEQNRQRLIQVFCDRFASGEQFKTITQARKLAADVLGEPVRPGAPLAKAVEEAIEQAVILTARQMIAQERFPWLGDTFDKLVDLYKRQPTLGTRTSNSVAMQAYSTTVPLAFLAGKLAGITTETSIYEPTAGRGALLMLSSPDKVFVNELDPNRARDLKAQGYNVTQQDAIHYRPPASVDVVIANPPFARRKKDEKVERFQIGCPDTPIETSELDQAISWRALEAMKDDGRAVLIIGSERGTDEQREAKYSTARAQKFFFNLYRQYKIEDHFTVDGNLYSKQGAAFPVDVIVVAGRKPIPQLSPNIDRGLPSVDLPRVYNSYNELKSVLIGQGKENEHSVDRTLHSERSGVGTRREYESLGRAVDAEYGRNSGSRTLPNGTGGTASGNDRSLSPQQSAPELGELYTRAVPERTEYGDLPTDSGRNQHPQSARGKPPPRGETERGHPIPSARRERPHQASTRNRSRDESDSRRVANPSNTVTPKQTMTTSAEPSLNPTANEQLGQVPYRPRSKSKSLNSFVPPNLEAPIQTALDNLERTVGNVDAFVADQLNFGSVENLHRALAAEQVDGVALAVRNLQQGKAALIGDDTGLGKGRQMASAIKYSLETGNIPVFITKDPGLYADMVRDLIDIGLDSGLIRPFMTNSDQKIPLPDGRTLKTSPNSHKRELNQMIATEELLPQYNMIFSTYSQLQTVEGQHTPRREFLLRVIDKGILVLDEAHEAGGSSNDVNKNVADRATYTRTLVRRAKGVFFASATATKRPDVMDLYAMRMNVADITSVHGLQSVLENGGTPLQQVATAMMAEDGQYIRRARDYDGVEVGSKVVETAHSDADQLSEIMREILKFDKDKQLAVAALNKEAKAMAKGFGTDNSTGWSGAKSTGFSSIMWNVVDQAALARKADAVADYALAVLKEDEKPFIGLSNTMGSFLDKYVKAENIKSGDPINVSFQDVLSRYLERSRDVTIKDYSGTVTDRRPLTDQELGPTAVDQYQQAEKLINQATFEQMPVSPIDWIRYRIESEGYKFGELTGRKARLDYDADGNAFYQARSTAETSKAAKLDIIGGFNSGKIDVGLGNRSASTGYSMHASEKFTDQRRRHFLIAQPERDINVFKQFMGRFHRTGQVNAPKISLIVGNTPDEKRPAAVLAKKLASLNANTTAARQGGIDFSDIPDYLNQIGDQVVSDMMRFDPDLSEALYDPISVTEDSNKPVEGAVAKVTGCLPMLPVVEQEAFYKQLDTEYKATLARYAALGENPLEAKSLDLDARTLGDVELVAQQEESQSVFAQGIRAEVVDVKVQSKPKPQLEVINDIRKTVGLPIARSVEQHDQAEIDALSTQLVEDLYQKTITATERYKFYKKTEYTKQALDPEKQLGKNDKLEIRLTKQLEALTQIRRLRPGSTVRVVSNNDRVFYGAITAVKKRGQSLDVLTSPAADGKENPAIPSRWELVIALADAERQISLPLSKLNTQSGGVGTYTVSIAQFSITDGDIYKMFDERQGGDREARILLKGNLLRLAETPYQSKGDLVVATMSNGQPEPVMLMEPGFNLEKEMQTSPVVLPSAETIRQFMQVTRNKGVVKTLDNSIIFKPLKDGGFALQTGKPRKDIFLDQGLQDAAASEFVSVGDRMEMRIPNEQLDLVLEYLKTERGKSVAAFSDHETARDLLGIKLPEIRLADTVEEVITREGLAPSVDMGNLEAIRQKMAATYDSEPAVPNIEPQELAEQLGNDSNEVAEPNADVAEGNDSSEVVSGGHSKQLDLSQVKPVEETTPPNDEAGADTPVPPAENIVPSEEDAAPVELQRTSKHRLLCEKRVVRFLQESGIAPHIAATDNFHMKIENDPYIPLVVEAHEKGKHKLVFLTHYIQENGDTFHDGEMVFKLQKNGYLAFEEVAARGPRGEVRGYDKGFAAIFSQNVLEQGFATAAKQQLEGTPEAERAVPELLGTKEEILPLSTTLEIQNASEEASPQNVETENVDCDEIPRLTPEEAFLDQVFHDFDGDEDVIIDGIFDGTIQLPPELSEENMTDVDNSHLKTQDNPVSEGSPSVERSGKSERIEPKTKEVSPETPSKPGKMEAIKPKKSPPAAKKPALSESPPATIQPYIVIEDVPAAPPIKIAGPKKASTTQQRVQGNATKAPSSSPKIPREQKEQIGRTPRPKAAKSSLKSLIGKGLKKIIPFYSRLNQKGPRKTPISQTTGAQRKSETEGSLQQHQRQSSARRKEKKGIGSTLKRFLGKGLKKLIPFYGRSKRTNESKGQTSAPTVTPPPLESPLAANRPSNRPVLSKQPNQENTINKTKKELPSKIVEAKKSDVERAIKAAHYLGKAELGKALEKLSTEQASKPNITMTASLQQEAMQTRSLARQKLQLDLADQITPLAHKLLQTAEAAGLVIENEGVKVFKGKQYAIRSQRKESGEQIEVSCRRGAGYINSVNSKVQKVNGLQIKDKDRFTLFASKSPGQLKQMVKEKRRIAGVGISD